MRFIFLAPLMLAACAGVTSQDQAIYLYPKAKVEVVSSSGCVKAENMTDDVLVPLIKREPGEHTVSDQNGRAMLRVAPC